MTYRHLQPPPPSPPIAHRAPRRPLRRRYLGDLAATAIAWTILLSTSALILTGCVAAIIALVRFILGT